MSEEENETPETDAESPEQEKPKPRTVIDIIEKYKAQCNERVNDSEEEAAPEEPVKPRLTPQSTTLDGWDEQVKKAMQYAAKQRKPKGDDEK
jgi:hypothetical protein